ncbi:hypothetical protein [Ancylobacter sp. FA202]|nr:hypothetical protein [Ancylobacter sp. FA202]
MTANPSRPITIVLLGFLALCLAAIDIQHFGLMRAALGALASSAFGATP